MSHRTADAVMTAAFVGSLVTTGVAACLAAEYRSEAARWRAEVKALLQPRPYQPAVIPSRQALRIKT